tara:strand:- start:2193 stop:4685 length:2493 start_codon:yes stop_codon:yes gene_type:complete
MKTCHGTFENNTEELLKIFARWPFPLSDFQKFAIDAILQGKHAIITAHTGNGKTLAADFAIKHFTDMGKKIIYTTPIKALTNQKYNTFQKKYPNITFGIITGDTTMNPDAQCVFATTEILRNTLFKKKWLENKKSNETDMPISLDIDINPSELGCVVFDEIHYIMDKNRGPVWHESIMMLPESVQILGLSATIDKPRILAEWIEQQKKKEVWLCPTIERVIPQHHYAFVTCPESFLDKLPQDTRTKFESMREKNVLMKKPGVSFQDGAYYNITKMLKFMRDKKLYIDKFYVLNQLIKYLKTKKYLPAICFVYSRKQVELIAQKINISLHEEGSKIPSIIENECKQMLMRKVSNYKEYINLPEFKRLIKCLEKGIAIHHAGMIQIFKEMVEHLFEKKYIKLLIATETFAVGVDMPAQSVIFTALQKFNGSKFRFLEPHECSQQSGRAGRRKGGDDTSQNIGRVWHLFNLFDIKNAVPDIVTYRRLLEGKAQPFVSTFKINFNLILRLLSIEGYKTEDFMKESLLSKDIDKKRCVILDDISHIEGIMEIKKLTPLRTPIIELKRYNEINMMVNNTTSKKRKQLIREKRHLEEKSKFFKDDFGVYETILGMGRILEKLERDKNDNDNYISNEIALYTQILEKNDFIGDNALTEKGLIAANIQEMHCLAMADILQNKLFDDLNVPELASVLSIFTQVSVKGENNIVKAEYINAPNKVVSIVKKIKTAYNKYYDIESYNQTSFTQEYNIHFNMCELVYKWCTTENEEDCYKIFDEAIYYNISRGEFVKALMKINNVTNELAKIAEIQSNMTLLEKTKEIPNITLKSIVTNQSLYL